MKKVQRHIAWIGLCAIMALPAAGQAQAPVPGPDQPREAPLSRTIQSMQCVVELFSCQLPQSSLGPVAESISACRGSLHGRACQVAVYILSRCHGILPIYKP